MQFFSLHRILLLCAGFFLAASGYAQPENDCPAYSHDGAPGALKVKVTAMGGVGHYDLAWLDPAIKTKKVLLLGENHWMSSLRALEEDIIFYANTKGSFPVLVLEVPYSTTGYLNAYLHSEPGADAYLTGALKPIFDTKESVTLLQHLRAWNAAHPTRQIQVACSDVEQSMGFAFKATILPYVAALGNTRLLARLKAAGDINDAIVAYMDSVVRQSPAGFAVPGKPFLTKKYLLNVLENFQVRYQAFRSAATQDAATSQAQFFAARQRQIVRNLTDDAFFGALLTRHNSILLGGASHMKVYAPAPGPGEDTSGEGWYLAHTFAPTKGRAYSLKLVNLSYNVPASYLQREVKSEIGGYQHLVDLYKDCPTISQQHGYRLINDLTPLTTALLPAFRHNHDQPVWLPGQPEMTRLLRQSAALRDDASWQEFYAHDAVVVLPTATLTELL